MKWKAIFLKTLARNHKHRQERKWEEDLDSMIGSSKTFCWVFAAAAAMLANPQAVAQEPAADQITEEDKKVFKDFMEAGEKLAKYRTQNEVRTQAVMNLRQIGLGLFEFETEYGSFPDEETAAAVKEATETPAEVKAATANDCFFQLIAAGIIQTDRVFSLEAPAEGEGRKPKPLTRLEKCAFSYLSGMNAAGNPGRPVVVAPLVNGQTTFDPTVLGGKAVVLRVDNSVTSLPIEKDGRVMINGMDLFDPAQPFWDGKVPPILWPED